MKTWLYCMTQGRQRYIFLPAMHQSILSPVFHCQIPTVFHGIFLLWPSLCDWIVTGISFHCFVINPDISSSIPTSGFPCAQKIIFLFCFSYCFPSFNPLCQSVSLCLLMEELAPFRNKVVVDLKRHSPTTFYFVRLTQIFFSLVFSFSSYL